MSKTRLISSLAAVCWLATAAFPQTNDAPGITVTMNGATVLHRTGVGYPQAALQHGVQGTVSVEVKLDATGNVSDARVLSGPDELRNATLQSVLQWHFTHDAAGGTRIVQIAFELPKPGEGQRTVGGTIGAIPTAAPPAPVPTAVRQVQMFATNGSPIQGGRIKSIRVAGLPDQLSAELLASLPVHEGDEWNMDALQKASQAVKAFDEHLTMQLTTMERTPSGTTDMSLLIVAPGGQPAQAATAAVPGRIKVGANVQSALILSKVPPVYPALAKSAGVSGVVQLAAILAKDGTVQELHVLSGPPLLVQAAMDAVKQWVYRPTLLNGNPVEVETNIEINFTLNQ
jgi:TonB family protein